MAKQEYNDDSIVSLSVTEQIRLRPSMWGFDISTVNGLLLQVKEIADNSFDEAQDRNKIYPVDITFFVSKDKSNYQCMIRDHGRGIPVGRITDVFVGGFSSGKYKGDYGGASTGTNGIGSKAVSVFSKLFLAFTKRPDGFGYGRIERGNVKDRYIQRRPIDKNESTEGTIVLFQPDPESFACIGEMFGKPKNDLEKNGFAKHLERISLAPVFRPNVKLTIRTVEGLLKPADLDKKPIELWKYLENLNNFKCTTEFESDTNMTPRMYVQKKFGLKEIAWQLGELHKITPNPKEDPLGFDIDVFIDEKTLKGSGGYIAGVNGTPIVNPDSSHIAQLHLVLKDNLADVIDDDEKKTFFLNKYRFPLSGCISAFWQGASFQGQDKVGFNDRQFEVYYRQHLRKEIKKITEATDGEIWERLWEIIKEHFEQEYAKFSRTSYKTGGDLKNLCYDLKRADSFFNCRLKCSDVTDTELFITEGDSAAGRVKSERDELTQAILKLSGKPKNAIRDDGAKLKNNAIYSDLCRILGVSRADTNLDNMRFKRILLMTDADADGYHIVALMLGMFYKINPLILEQGRVYVVNPPLYSILPGDSNSPVYMRDQDALEEARQIVYRTLFDIDVDVYNGKNVKHYNTNQSHGLFRDLCFAVDMIGKKVTHNADLLNVDPIVLEQLIHCVDYLDEKNVNCKEIKKILTAKDVLWDKSNNVVVLIYEVGDRSIEYRIPLARLSKVIRDEILPVYEKFDWKNTDIFITTKYSDLYVKDPCTYMMLYNIFAKISHPEKGILKVRRFKGLGEMSPKAIYDTCINPETRSYTVIKSIGDVNRIYKMLGVDTDERKKLINSGLVEEV